MNKDIYHNYNHKRYAHYRNVHTGSYKVEKSKSSKHGERTQPILEKVKVSFKEVKELNLDTIGRAAPVAETEDFTIVSNYLFDFWGAVLGDSVISTYLHLKRHAYNKKDYCYIDIDLIALKMNKSRNTVKGYLNQLEEYGFIASFLRIDTENNNRDVSPLFKLRRTVPLITQEAYDSLKPRLQKLHDEYMDVFENISFDNNIKKAKHMVEDIVKDGQSINDKETQKRVEESIENGKLEEFILNQLDVDQRDFDYKVHDLLLERVSKPSFDTWFKNTIFIQHSDMDYTILVNNDFTKEWFDNKYLDLFKEITNQITEKNIYFADIQIKLSSEYVRNWKSSVV